MDPTRGMGVFWEGFFKKAAWVKRQHPGEGSALHTRRAEARDIRPISGRWGVKRKARLAPVRASTQVMPRPWDAQTHLQDAAVWAVGGRDTCLGQFEEHLPGENLPAPAGPAASRKISRAGPRHLVRHQEGCSRTPAGEHPIFRSPQPNRAPARAHGPELGSSRRPRCCLPAPSRDLFTLDVDLLQSCSGEYFCGPGRPERDASVRQN